MPTNGLSPGPGVLLTQASPAQLEQIWARLESVEGSFGVACIYAPKSPRERTILWEELKHTLPSGNWILCGDFNMVERREDSTGQSPLLKGRQLESWRLLKSSLNLHDAFDIIGKIDGALFTWRRVILGKLTQSRLDRFYFSDTGWWTHAIRRLTHDGGQALSDHDPIWVSFLLSPPPDTNTSMKKTSPFRANSAVLKSQEAVEKLKVAWEDSRCEDPAQTVVQNALAWRR